MTIRSCATETREPCQAGNRAALSGAFRVPQGSRIRAGCRRNGHSPLFKVGVCSLVKSHYFLHGRGEGMYQALYRKWRPQTFDEVVGRSHRDAEKSGPVRPAFPCLYLHRHARHGQDVRAHSGQGRQLRKPLSTGTPGALCRLPRHRGRLRAGCRRDGRRLQQRR